MKKEVRIKITGTHGTGKDKDTVTSECSGLYFEKNDKIYLKYTEKDEKNGEVRNSTITVENAGSPEIARVTVEHRGNTDALIILEPGKKNRSSYVTPIGSMVLEVETIGLEIEKTDSELRIRADYHMSLGGAETIPSSVKILVKE